jgi:hypothetical protein
MSTDRENKGRNSKKYISLHLHKNWCDFIHYCEKIGYGEIQNLRIQDGVPKIAEVVKKKINFTKGEGSEP